MLVSYPISEQNMGPTAPNLTCKKVPSAGFKRKNSETYKNIEKFEIG